MRVGGLRSVAGSDTILPMKKEDRIAYDRHAYGVDLPGEPILFYNDWSDPWSVFSNFSDHSVILRNPWTHEPFTYATGEHRYQALKATTEKDHDYVALVNNPSSAKKRGREIDLREDWGNDYSDICWYVMLETVIAKTVQNHDVFTQLVLSTGSLIYEDSPTDDIWGVRYRDDWRGKNLLGRAWMEAREHVWRFNPHPG